MPDALRKLDPRLMWRNPVMLIVEIGAVFTTVLTLTDPSWFAWLITGWLWATVIFANLAEAVAEGRGKAQADTLRKTRQGTIARRLVGWSPGGTADRGAGPGPGSGEGRLRDLRGRRRDPRRRRRRRGHRQRRRVRDHRRVRSGHPGVRRRPMRRHRRHQGALRPHRRPDHPDPRRELHRPDDLPRRGRQPAEDPQRDRAQHLAGRAHAHLRDGRGDPAAAGDLRQVGQRGRPGHARPRRQRCDRHRPGRAPGVPDPHHDRGAAVSHRHRRHGPARPTQRARDEWTGRRGRRRRQHAAAGQDRHHHAGQPAGLRVRPGPRRRRRASWPTPPSCRAWPTRRPRVVRSSYTPSGRTACASASPGARHRDLGAVHGPDPDVRRRPRRPSGPQGRRRRGHALGARERRPPDRGRRWHR